MDDAVGGELVCAMFPVGHHNPIEPAEVLPRIGPRWHISV